MTSLPTLASRVPHDSGSNILPVVCVMVKRERARSLIRTAFPRRRAQLYTAKTHEDMVALFNRHILDAVVVDSALGEEAERVFALADDYPTAPFFLVTSMLPGETPLIGRAVSAGIADVFLEGVDDAVVRQMVKSRGFTRRFEAALWDVSHELGLKSELQLKLWNSLISRAGRSVRTDQLAREQNMSREHLSRSFAQGGAPTLKRVIDFVRVLAAAELSKSPGYDIKDVATVLGFASSSHLSGTTQRLVGIRASSLSRLRTVDLIARFLQTKGDIIRPLSF